MPFTEMDSISWKFAGKPYDLNSYPLNPDEVWEKLDSPPEEVRAALNDLINKLNAEPAAASVGFNPNEDVSAEANTVQTAFDSLVTILHGTGGATWLKSVGVTGLTGDNVQTLLESLKEYIDSLDTANDQALANHKLPTTNDHDGRYYTENEVDGFTVKKTGDQTIAGVKTFSSSPIVPTPTTDMQASTKKYVDDNFTTKNEITTNRKLSATGDFKGTLNGYPIVQADPGYSSMVAGINDTLNEHLAESAKRITPDMTTTEIQDILNNYREVLFLDGTFNVNPLSVPSNTVIHMSPGTVLKALPGYLDNTHVLYMLFVSNVTIYGNGATVSMQKAEYTTGVSRMGVNIKGSKHIRIYNLNSNDSGGDGFYIGNLGRICEDVALINCNADNNLRNGLTITNGKDILILGGEYTNANGAAPQFGIDIEPDEADDILENINLFGVKTSKNVGGGIQVVLNQLGSANPTNPVSINILNHTSVEDGSFGGQRIAVSGTYKVYGDVRIKNGTIIRPAGRGVDIARYTADLMPKVKFEDITVIDPYSTLATGSNADKSGFVMVNPATYDNYYMGNVEFVRCNLIDTRATVLAFAPFYLSADADRTIKNVKIIDCDIDPANYTYTGGILYTSGNMQNVIAPNRWLDVTLVNGWSNKNAAYNSAQYMKDSLGFVHLRGFITGGTIGSTAFILPVGYRPLKNSIFPAVSNSAFGEAIVWSTGDVAPYIGNNASFSLDGIVFLAEQ